MNNIHLISVNNCSTETFISIDLMYRERNVMIYARHDLIKAEQGDEEEEKKRLFFTGRHFSETTTSIRF